MCLISEDLPWIKEKTNKGAKHRQIFDMIPAPTKEGMLYTNFIKLLKKSPTKNNAMGKNSRLAKK